MLRLFVSYSHLDRNYMSMLSAQLQALVLSGTLSEWTDRLIMPGSDWERQISHEIHAADIIVLLISANYLNSKHATSEMNIALSRNEQWHTPIIPIIVSPCAWKHLSISKFNALPDGGQCLSNSSNLDQTLADITSRIYELATNISSIQQILLVENSVKLAAPFENASPADVLLNRVKAFAHSDRVMDAAFSRNESYLATVCRDGKIRVYELRGFQKTIVIQAEPDTLRSVSWSRSGKEIATGDSEGSVRLWRDGAELAKLRSGISCVRSAEYSPDGMGLCAAADDGVLSMWRPQRRERTWAQKIHDAPINSVRFDRSGKWLVTASSDGNCAVVNVRDGEIVSRASHHNGKVSIAIFCETHDLSGFTCVSSGEDGKVFMWDPFNPKVRRLITEHSFWVLALSTSHDGGMIASGGYDGHFRLIENSKGNVFETAAVDHGPIYCIRFSPSDRYLVISSDDCFAYLYEIAAR